MCVMYSWASITNAQVQFPARAVVRVKQTEKYSLPCLVLALNGCELHVKLHCNFLILTRKMSRNCIKNNFLTIGVQFCNSTKLLDFYESINCWDHNFESIPLFVL